MLSTDVEQELIIKRIEQVVSLLMEERPFFKEELDYSKIVQQLAKLFKKNLPLEEFKTMSDQELKSNCSIIMVTEAVAGTLNELTPEQMTIFDQAIKRK